MDVLDALKRGIADFRAMPSHAFFLAVIYPVIGIVLGRLVLDFNSLPMLYPLIAGFPIVGAFAAVGLYELSRRRERGLDTHAKHALDVLHSHNAFSIALLGGMLTVLFVAWLVVAQIIFGATMGGGNAVWTAPSLAFFHDLFDTREGWTMIVIGNAVGCVFAILAFALSVISFPLLLDRDIGAAQAAATSLRAVIANPGPMALWGAIVAGALALGSLPFLVGLVVVLPVLGHATWHLYRRVVAP